MYLLFLSPTSLASSFFPTLCRECAVERSGVTLETCDAVETLKALKRPVDKWNDLLFSFHCQKLDLTFAEIVSQALKV